MLDGGGDNTDSLVVGPLSQYLMAVKSVPGGDTDTPYTSPASVRVLALALPTAGRGIRWPGNSFAEAPLYCCCCFCVVRCCRVFAKGFVSVLSQS